MHYSHKKNSSKFVTWMIDCRWCVPTCLHHSPKHFQMTELRQRYLTFLLTHSLISTFLCCISMSWAGQRPAPTTIPSSLRQRAGWQKGDTFLESRTGFDWCGFLVKFTGCSEILFCSYYAAHYKQGDNPKHLYSHLSTHIHITKRVCVSESSFA